MRIHNEEIARRLRPSYTTSQLDALFDFLRAQRTFDFPSLANGLFPAASLASSLGVQCYRDVWVRDNVHIAHAHLAMGHGEIAARTAASLLDYFRKHRWRLVEMVEGKSDPANAMQRPHVRFNGHELCENDEKWAHAQNDALGYFVWLVARLGASGHLRMGEAEAETLAVFVDYFAAIEYWQDEDSGHWEETRKISASSIGSVVAGLSELHGYVTGTAVQAGFLAKAPSPELIESLREKGKAALERILPWECVQADPSKRRQADAALLFLIYPLRVVDESMADAILENVRTLGGEIGIRRYLGDSYWAADYKRLVAEELRTADYSEDMATRDILHREGHEAQWLLFDPILSAIHGERFRRDGNAQFLERQVHHFNRSLAAITGSDSPFGPFKVPESYYRSEDRYVPNDVTPLLWAQANLWLAFGGMKESLRHRSGAGAEDEHLVGQQ